MLIRSWITCTPIQDHFSTFPSLAFKALNQCCYQDQTFQDQDQKVQEETKDRQIWSRDHSRPRPWSRGQQHCIKYELKLKVLRMNVYGMFWIGRPRRSDNERR